jgi:hypothetical protein
MTQILIDLMAEASGILTVYEDPADVRPITDATSEWIAIA